METWIEDEHGHKKKSVTAATLTAAAAAAAAAAATATTTGVTATTTVSSTLDHSNRPSIGGVSVGATSSGDASVLNTDDEVNGVDWSPEIPFENVSIDRFDFRYCWMFISIKLIEFN